LVESFEEAVEDLLAADLAFVGGVVALSAEGGFELDGGDEEGAGLADRFEVAVHLDGSGAVAVAEHASVHLGAQVAHLGAFVGGGELLGLAVEGFDFLGGGEVLVSDGLVGDAGVDHGHCEGLVAEERGDRVDAHASVDGLGGEGVSQLVWGDVADAGVGGDSAEGVGDTELGDGSAVFE